VLLWSVFGLDNALSLRLSEAVVTVESMGIRPPRWRDAGPEEQRYAGLRGALTGITKCRAELLPEGIIIAWVDKEDIIEKVACKVLNTLDLQRWLSSQDLRILIVDLGPFC
jgi:hypothetical protein